MFRRSVPPKSHTLAFPSEVHPEAKIKKQSNNTVSKSLNSYKVIRDKVMHDMTPKPSKAQPKAAVKKKLLVDQG